jgi:hypothetical protein
MRFLAIEIARLADAIDARYRAMVLVACYCGLCTPTSCEACDQG